MSERKKNPNVISKTFTIIRAFTDIQPEWGVNELARYLKTPVSTLHRMLKTLREEEILKFSQETKKYLIGNEMFRLSTIVTSSYSIKNLAKEYMKPITETYDRSVYLALYHQEPKMLSFVERVNSTYAFQYVLDFGILHPLNIAASGKTILANLNAEDQKQAITKGKLSNVEKRSLHEELKTIQKQGYAITKNEREIGALGISTPIFDASKSVVASITCIIPVSSYREEESEKIIKTMKTQAALISYHLGYSYRDL